MPPGELEELFPVQEPTMVGVNCSECCSRLVHLHIFPDEDGFDEDKNNNDNDNDNDNDKNNNTITDGGVAPQCTFARLT